MVITSIHSHQYTLDPTYQLLLLILLFLLVAIWNVPKLSVNVRWIVKNIFFPPFSIHFEHKRVKSVQTIDMKAGLTSFFFRTLVCCTFYQLILGPGWQQIPAHLNPLPQNAPPSSKWPSPGPSTEVMPANTGAEHAQELCIRPLLQLPAYT